MMQNFFDTTAKNRITNITALIVLLAGLGNATKEFFDSFKFSSPFIYLMAICLIVVLWYTGKDDNGDAK